MLLISTYDSVLASVDPFSKITITSDSATCKAVKSTLKNCSDPKMKKQSEQFFIDYQKNVCVTFADQSTVTSDSLNIIFNGNPQGMKKNALENFKKITFSNNVCITSAQRNARADRAELFLGEKKCILEGNVKICQTKEKASDIPISIVSQRAEFCLDEKHISLTGSSHCPVSTTIVLEGHPSMMYKKDLKKKKHGNHKNSTTRNSA